MSSSDTKPIIMFDMDGTLLDLAFDDLIWNQKLPERHAQTHQIHIEQSNQILFKFYQEHKHTLSWYSTQFWSAKVGVDTLQLQYDFKDKIQARSGCFELLEQLKILGYRCWLVTNADQFGLALKMQQVNLTSYFEVMVSSSEFGFAKERYEFWEELQKIHPFDPSNCILVDDTAVVLEGARSFGIQKLVTIIQPSSLRAAKSEHELNYPAILDLTELMNYLNTNKDESQANVQTA